MANDRMEIFYENTRFFVVKHSNAFQFFNFSNRCFVLQLLMHIFSDGNEEAKKRNLLSDAIQKDKTTKPKTKTIMQLENGMF